MMKEPETNICGQSVCHPLAVRCRQTEIAHPALVRARMGEIFHGPQQSVALGREPRQQIGLMARHSATKHIKNFSAVTSSTQCLAKFLKTGDWGRFNENGRALPRHGRRMHQMDGRGVYGRSAPSRICSLREFGLIPHLGSTGYPPARRRQKSRSQLRALPFDGTTTLRRHINT
jgi:hypothetical protein